MVVTSLGKGGAERSAAILTNMLASLGHEVHVVSIVNTIDFEYSGTLLNLGLIKEKQDSLLGKIKRFKVFKRYLKKHQFDVVIDNRTKTPNLREFSIAFLLYDLSKTIYVVRSYKIASYFPRSKWLTKTIIKRLSAVVGVSEEICDAIRSQYPTSNVICIQNPIQPFSTIVESDMNGKYILAYGRLDDAVKNYSLLIDAYAQSKLPESDYKLLILGSGKDEVLLKNKVKILHLTEKVVFKPFVKNPSGYIKNAHFVCLTSRVEGFPRTLVESLSLGVPVISVDCKSGPKEIIMHKKNGLIVENFNAKAFAEAMNSLIFEVNLYDFCKLNAPVSITHLKFEVITTKWKQLLEQLN